MSLLKKSLLMVFRRTAEVLAITSSLIFFYELTTADRYLSALDVNAATHEERRDFIETNDRSIVYLDLSLARDNYFDAKGCAVDAGQPILATSFPSAYLTVIDRDLIGANILTRVVNECDEDFSIRFTGPVYIAQSEQEGIPELRITAAPFTDVIAERARCTEVLLDERGLRWLRRYIAACMF